jgi:two-component sensor histidine kinase
MNLQDMQNVVKEIEAIKELCKESGHLERWEMRDKISTRIEVLQAYCEQKGIPIKIDIEEILNHNHSYSYEEDDSSYYEEDSSYYEEESSW